MQKSARKKWSASVSIVVSTALFLIDNSGKTLPLPVVIVLLVLIAVTALYASSGWICQSSADAAGIIGRVLIAVVLIGGGTVWFGCWLLSEANTAGKSLPGGNGVYLGPGADDIQINGVKSTDNESNGIAVDGAKHVTVRDSELKNNGPSKRTNKENHEQPKQPAHD